jgi:hypothetical protein
MTIVTIQIHAVDVTAAAAAVDAVAVSHKVMSSLPTKIRKKAMSRQKVRQKMAQKVQRIVAAVAVAQVEMASHLVRSSMKMA